MDGVRLIPLSKSDEQINEYLGYIILIIFIWVDRYTMDFWY